MWIRLATRNMRTHPSSDTRTYPTPTSTESFSTREHSLNYIVGSCAVDNWTWCHISWSSEWWARNGKRDNKIRIENCENPQMSLICPNQYLRSKHNTNHTHTHTHFMHTTYRKQSVKDDSNESKTNTRCDWPQKRQSTERKFRIRIKMTIFVARGCFRFIVCVRHEADCGHSCIRP